VLTREFVGQTAGQNWHYVYRGHVGVEFMWHYHPEFELTLTRGARGTRYLGSDVTQFDALDLVLVAPEKAPDRDTQAMAAGADDLVEAAPVFASLAEAAVPAPFATIDGAMRTHPAMLPDQLSTVLVIDDNLHTRELLPRCLGGLGVHVVTAASAEEGLGLVHALAPELITLGTSLRGMDGWDLLAQLKATPTIAHIPVLMLAIGADQQTGFMLDACDILAQPIDPDRLIELACLHAACDTADRYVLLASADKGQCQKMREVLDRAGWRMVEAADGAAAMARAAEHRPALVLIVPLVSCTMQSPAAISTL